MSDVTALDGSVTVTVPSSPKYLRIVRRVLEAYMEDLSLDPAELQHIILAVDEACSNVIKYAYAFDDTKKISVSVSDTTGQLEFTIRDFGKKPDVTSITPRDLDDVRPGGLGTHFIQCVMDEVSYDLNNDVGTLLRMSIKYRAAETAEKVD